MSSKQKKFFATFGWGQDHAGCYVIILADDENEARAKMFDAYEDKWAFMYDKAHWYQDGIAQNDKWNYTLLETL